MREREEDIIIIINKKRQRITKKRKKIRGVHTYIPNHIYIPIHNGA